MSIAQSIPSHPPLSIPLLPTSSLPLPHELIDRIIAYHANNLPVLLALARSSRDLYLRTVPVLYRNPFSFIDCAERSWGDKVKRYNQLLSVLLSGLDTSSPALMTDYLAYYAYQCHLDVGLRLAFDSWASHSRRSGVAMVSNIGVDYIADDSLLEEICRSDVAMVSHNPATVKVLGQPLCRMRMFLNNVQWLSSLTRIELYGISSGGNGQSTPLPSLEPTLEFIRVHDAIHSTLREIKIGGSYDYGLERNYSRMRLIRVIQAMRTPQVVDARHWREANLIIDQIPVECLRELYLDFGEMPPNKFQGSLFLQRCRYLERLRIPVINQNLFKWAADWRHTGIQPPIVAALQQQDDEEAYYDVDRRLSRPPRFPRLRSVDLTGEDYVLIPALKHVMDAFRDTIESIEATTLAHQYPGACQYTDLRLRWTWTLRALRELVLVGEVVLALDFGMLAWCPALAVLRLALPPYMFMTSEDEEMEQFLQTESDKLCLAVRLLELELTGKWPLSDAWLDRLSNNVRRLTDLRIATSTGYTAHGLRIAAERLGCLEKLHIRRSMFVSSAERQQLERIRSNVKTLTIVEE
ncbi:hypothetical protein BGW42_001555 [Actinomortierella wolfii]|nr:hypothetical protein BGW42_001555 [Actinomortierella wolfii]